MVSPAISQLNLAYTHYAFFEWSLVLWDIAFDAFAVSDLAGIKVCSEVYELI